MLKVLFDPKVDFVFKNIFGAEDNKDILISFLNATIKPKNLIKSVELKNTDIQKEYVEDKFSRLDIKATTNNQEIIDIEIQLKNEYNMIKRSLYYWSKIYEEQLGESKDYCILNRTICINILNFNLLKTEKFHSTYRLKEIETNEELTDVQEIHFIEIPKLKDEYPQEDLLVAWTEFLKNPESEKVRKFESEVIEIKKAKEQLMRISCDEKERADYEMRMKSLRDKESALNSSKREGIEIGKIETVKSFLDVLDDDTIALKTGLDVEFIKSLRENN